MSAENERLGEIRTTLQGVLQPGERYRVECGPEGEVRATPIKTMGTLRDNHPRLHGLLHATEDSLDGTTGCGQWALVALLGMALCLGLESGWFAAQLPEGSLRTLVEKGASGWTYAGIFFVLLALWGSFDDFLERRVYRSMRGEIAAELDRARIDPYVLITALTEDDECSSLRKHLARDKGLASTSSML